MSSRLLNTAVLAAIVLCGCSPHKNPMINDQAFSGLNNFYAFRSGDSFSPDDSSGFQSICFPYFSEQTSPSEDIKQKCEAQLKRDYQEMRKHHLENIFQGGNFDDLRDVHFWKRFRGIDE